MKRSRKLPLEDDALESREAAHTPPEPKRRRKKKDAAELAAEKGLTTADHLPAQPPFDPGSHLAAEPSFAERVRPNGPRERGPNEAGTVYRGTNHSRPFRLAKHGALWSFSFPDTDPATAHEKDIMYGAGFRWDESARHYSAVENGENAVTLREDAQRAAVLIDGKDISHGRGR